MKLVLLLGPPGAGKGTQCGLLSSRLNFKHISTGTIIRQEISSQSELGLRVKSLVESGNLVDDETMFVCLEKALTEMQGSSDDVILLDGLPRNVPQAVMLNNLVAKTGLFESVKVICLLADTNHLMERFQSRYTCSACGHIDSIVSTDSYRVNLHEYGCKSCGKVGSMTRRKDDEVMTVRHRLEVYNQETLPMISYYKEQNLIDFVDGLAAPEFVYLKVASFLI